MERIDSRQTGLTRSHLFFLIDSSAGHHELLRITRLSHDFVGLFHPSMDLERENLSIKKFSEAKKRANKNRRSRRKGASRRPRSAAVNRFSVEIYALNKLCDTLFRRIPMERLFAGRVCLLLCALVDAYFKLSAKRVVRTFACR